MEYLDFEIEIGHGEGRNFPVEVIRSPAGEPSGEMRFPFTELELENHLLKVQNALLSGTTGTRRRVSAPIEGPVQHFGSELYEALLNDDIRTCYELSRREAQIQGKGLRLKLRVTDPALAVLPWEFLYDESQGEFVALSSNTPIVRTLDLRRVQPPLRITAPLRVLGMIASPEDLPPLNVEREKQRIERAIAPLRARGAVEITWLETGTWQELQRAMRRGPWHVFHFVGHGRYDVNTDEGTLALVSQTGETDQLTATQMGRLLADHPSLRLVVLNSCEGAKGGKTDVFSGTAATLVRRGLPAVVAMQYEITDRAAIAFAQTFYESISDGLPLDAAVAEARKAVSFSTASTVEWGTPVLYMQAPDGVLFVLDNAADGKSPAAARQPEHEHAAADTRLPSAGHAKLEPSAKPEPSPKAAASPSPEPTPAPRSAFSQVIATAAHSTPTPIKSTPAAAPSTSASAQPATSAQAIAKPAPSSAPSSGASSAPSPKAAEATPAPVAPAPGQGYVFPGSDGQLFVEPTTVTISRRGPGGISYREGERVIPIQEVTAVHLAPASATGRGFIQVCYQGGAQIKTSYWQAGKHTDTIQFTLLQQDWFSSAKQWIDYYIALAHTNTDTKSS